ncbi:MAG: histidine phosphatase family protein [Bryobacteraceae bacterium]|nr:histidine phosphatase family protein [Bryobacteraceae bacterium]
MRSLYVIRHGEPALKGVMLGRVDPPLSEAGRHAAREALSSLKVEIVYASPLQRARETAAFINAPIRILDDLAEMAYGDWEGLPWTEIETRWPDLVARKLADWWSVTPPGGETRDQVAARAARALAVIRNGPFPAAVVAHGGLNAELLWQACGRDPLRITQGYCDVIEIGL